MLANTLAVGRRARPGPARCSRASSTPRSTAASASIPSARRRWSWSALGPEGAAASPPGAAAGARARRDAAVERTRSTIRSCARCTRPPASPALDDVIAWRRGDGAAAAARRAGRSSRCPRPRATSRPLGETIQRRGSTRRFAHAPLSAERARDRAVGGRRGRGRPTCRAASSISTSIVNAVDGVAPGAYAYWPGRTGSS